MSQQSQQCTLAWIQLSVYVMYYITSASPAEKAQAAAAAPRLLESSPPEILSEHIKRKTPPRCFPLKPCMEISQKRDPDQRNVFTLKRTHKMMTLLTNSFVTILAIFIMHSASIIS